MWPNIYDETNIPKITNLDSLSVKDQPENFENDLNDEDQMNE